MNPHEAPQTGAHASPLLVEAAAVVDADRVHASPGALLLDGCTVLAVGSPQAVGRHPAGGSARRISRHGSVLVPAFVNAHAHLDLTHIGPQPYERDGGFVGWVDRIRASRLNDEGALRDSMRDGIDRLLRGGVGAVGDIAGVGSLVPVEELAASGVRGVSYIEQFGVGARQERAIEALRGLVDEARRFETGRVRVGVQPHAPYSAGLRLYRAAMEMGVPVTTHLAETPEEAEFVRSGTGAQRMLLERLGVWDDSILEEVGRGERSIQHLAPVVREALVAHCNDVSDGDVQLLLGMGVTVAYCPRCSAYFHREDDFGAHRYRDMLDAGVPVALGTDSVVNLPCEEARRLSPLDEMRVLRERDGTEARTLLAMATLHALRGLRLDEGLGRFEGEVLGVLALEGASLDDAVRRGGEIEWIAGAGCA